jgi:hypothetical protein
MYARSASEGDVVRVRELRARTCDAAPRAWAVASQTLGEQGSRFHSELSVIAADRPAARRLRARFSRVAGERLAPRPCALQVWERTVVLTASGADQVRWAPLREWLVARPDSVIRFPAP